ncbi:uncharacterized protein LOC9643764 [Selaginella moellendorffii]|uniref:uncharacterized protein LOC9643764 n=1 Tax=Selaginella moellendorffii TaxID=88036 RepID=UPI000D1CF86A|nr:uncharacterized protein LOC9643764 [Selaginella moellendorffii]|eukprot:XP_024524160.1 uncharacterized protein LOC9643764 [Selaginella moellendorffii]
MDEELAKVQAQIGLLQPQIQAAGESFLSACESGNQSLVEYWQKEEEQLWKEEEQLRKEEEQLRNKELLLLKSNVRGSDFIVPLTAPAPAAGLPPADSYVPDMIAWAKKLDENLTADFADGGIDWTSHATFRELHIPAFSGTDGNQTYMYMGRSLFKEIESFVSALRHGTSDNDNKPPGIIIGTPGWSGKTTVLATVAGYLRHLWKNTSKKVVFINGEDLVDNPLRTMWLALLLSYIDDLPAELLCRGWTLEALESWILSRWSEQLYFLVDEANAFDTTLNRKLGAPSAERRDEAYHSMKTMQLLHVVVYCSSVGPLWRSRVVSDKSPPYMLVTGGYSAEELQAYCEHEVRRAGRLQVEDPIVAYCRLRTRQEHRKLNANAKRIKVDGSEEELNLSDMELCSEFKSETGWVPGLVAHYGTWKLRTTYHMYEAGLREYIQEAVKDRDRWDSFIAVLGGVETIRRVLRDALDTRCFYVDPETQTGKCLSDSLRARTMVLITETLRYASDFEARMGIGQWTGLIRHDDNSARVGWNAEMATLIFIKHYGIVIDTEGLQLNFKPEVVVRFEGDFSPQFLIADNVSRFFPPVKFNHTGVDCLGENEKHVLWVQIATGVDVVLKHGNTLSRFLEMTKGDAREKVLVWILAVDSADKIWIRNGVGYKEVFICFGRLSEMLKVIDVACCRLHLESSKNVKVASNPEEAKAEAEELRKLGRCGSLSTGSGNPCRRFRGDEPYCHHHDKRP